MVEMVAGRGVLPQSFFLPPFSWREKKKLAPGIGGERKFRRSPVAVRLVYEMRESLNAANETISISGPRYNPTFRLYCIQPKRHVEDVPAPDEPHAPFLPTGVPPRFGSESNRKIKQPTLFPDELVIYYKDY